MTTLKSKVSVQLFGGAQIKGAPDTVQEMRLGIIMGVCSGLFAAKAQDGVTDIWGLKGNFRAMIDKRDANGAITTEVVESGKCYLPEAFQGPIEELFQGVAKLDDKGEPVKDENGKTVWEQAPIKSIEFAYEVWVVRAGNKAGYSWAFKPLLDAAQNDPLDKLQSAVMAKVEQIAPPTPAPAAGGKSK